MDARDGAGVLRDEALRRYGVGHLGPRRQLQALVDLAALICDVPMAAINLIGSTDQHRVATVGIGQEVCSRDGTLCSTSLLEARPVFVPDATLDARFRDNVFVNGDRARVRFYASHQLRTPEGVVIGTLCVFDGKPRHLDESQFEALGTLADRVVDVLELELVSRQMAEANQRLAAANERLTGFVGQVSHDLGNPLASITMALEMAADEARGLPRQEGEPLAQMLDRAGRGASRMHEMVAALLDFAIGGREAERTEVDLAETVQTVLEDLRPVTGEAVVTYRDLPSLQADPVQLRVLMQNLLGNALKFSRDQHPPQVEVTAAHLGGAWRIEIHDNGPGIPAQDRERVFEVFARTDLSVPGTGIGLSTCQRIMQAHGGTIGIEESRWGGTSVWISLPDVSRHT